MKRVVYIFVFLIFGWSCSDFLEEDSQNLTYVESIGDLTEVLMGEGYMNSNTAACRQVTGGIPAWIHLLDDDMQFNTDGMGSGWAISGFASGVYGWQKDPFRGYLRGESIGVENSVWEELYRYVNAANIILYEAEEFKGEPDYNHIKGEAYFLRAGYYWWLLNIYAKAYDVKTAGSDPGVPLKLTSYVEDYEEEGGFSRNSVAEVYEQIVADLENAIQLLSGYSRKSVYRASETAARLFLSRIYLHMEDYEGVIAQCDSILEKNTAYRLRDYNALSEGESLVTSNSSEVIFSHGGDRTRIYFGGGAGQGSEIEWTGKKGKVSGSLYLASDDLKDAFDDAELQPDQSTISDLRWSMGFADCERSGLLSTDNLVGVPCKLRQWSDGIVSDCFTLRLAEVYLNKAEALAVLGQESEANNLWHELRAKRLTSTNPVNLSGDKLVRGIRAERRLEFTFEGFRWVDLRRYAVNSKYPQKNAITHIWREKDWLAGLNVQETYELAPYEEDSAAWVFPIPSDEHRINDNLVPNDERPAREPLKSEDIDDDFDFDFDF